MNRDPGSPTSPSTGPGDLTLTAPPNEVQFVEPRSPGQAQGGGHGAELEGLEAFELTTFLASDDPRERRRGLDNLVDRSDPQADRILGAFVRDDNDGSVRQHAWALVITRWDERLGNHGALQEIVGWQLAHGGERAAIEAARAMGRNGDRADLLAPGLRHPNHDVVLASIQAVQGVQRRSSDADWWSLIEPLTASSNPKVAALARELLRDTEPPPPARSDPRLDTATQQIQSGAE